MPTFSSINLYKPLRELLEREDDDSFPPIKTPDALITRDAKHVARFLSFPLPQVYHLRACVADAILSEPINNSCGWDLLQKYHVDSSSSPQTSFSTGSRALDEMVCGRNIIQVSGPSPSGKTQLALSIAVHSTTTTTTNSKEDSIVYYWTSSYSSFPLVRRLQQMICVNHRDDALHKIHFQSIHNGHQLHASIQYLLSSPKSHYVLLLDSASAIFSNHSNNKDQDIIIYQCCISLRKLAHTKQVKIFITNGTVQSGEKVALGNTRWNPADIDLLLNCCTDTSTPSMRIINVSYLSSDIPHNGEAQVTIGINSSGIVDLPHPST